MAERAAEDERHRARLNYLADQEQTERDRQERVQKIGPPDHLSNLHDRIHLKIACDRGSEM